MKYQNQTLFAIAVAAALLVSACGGGGGGTASSGTSFSLSGSAATGAAIGSGTVEAKCATGSISTTTAADGSYLLTSNTAQLPCLLRATVPETGDVLHSVAEAGATLANITPVTDLMAASVLGDNPANKYANFSSSDAAAITASKVNDARLIVIEAAKTAGADFTGLDPLKDAFTPATSTKTGDLTDQKIDQLMAALAAADKKIADLSTQLATVTKAQAATAVTTTLGASVKSLDDCPYVRGGNIWTFMYDGTGLTEWSIDIDAMAITKIGSGATATISKLRDSNSNIVPCAYTFNTGTSTVTTYVSSSGVMTWKELITSSGGYFFGLGVPKQVTHRVTDAKYVGRFPGLMYIDAYANGVHALDTASFYFDINSSGEIAMATCDLKSQTPSCGSPVADSNSTMTCSANQNGTLNCISNDGSIQATAILFVSQQEPTLFVTYSATISGATVKALMLATKAASMVLPKVGDVQSASTSWYVGRNPKNNANTAWTFASGETSSGVATTVTSIDALANSYTRQNGQVVFYNTPASGTYWIPSYGNSIGNYVGLSSKGGWTAGASTTNGNRVFDGRVFYVKKPMLVQASTAK